jgi:uncharacterized membrane protein
MTTRTPTEPPKNRTWSTWLTGAAIGALTMYFSDPERGRRRRAKARDKANRMMTRSANAIEVARRDLGNRVQGLQARTRKLIRTGRRSDTDDPVLAARVRARIGRAITHSHPVHVYVREGEVTLSGPVLASEKDALLKAVRSVPGVRALNDHLTEHAHPDGIPALQGHPERTSAALGHWPPGLRALATAGGGMLAFYGMRQRGAPGSLLGVAGLGLLARSLVNRPLLGMRPGASSQSIHLTKTLHIAAAPDKVFDIWSDYRHFPYFMSHVKEVRDLGEGRSHWTVDGPAGIPVEWDAVLSDSRRPERLAWHTVNGSSIQHRGEVHFEPELTGTRVSVHLSYRPPAGVIGHTAAALFGKDPKHQLEADLMRMKVYIEEGIVPHDAAQPLPPLGVQPGAGIH